jgi:alpha-amylase/alpha-mannosidase (GH57 family)
VQSSRYLIIHGHFYQPPRSNPWSGSIPIQLSAAPFANWNQRISRECYSPNTVARILGDDGLIVKIINNFEHISFNVGPTLLLWLKEGDRETYDRIVAADKAACPAHGGHGPAIAQVFNHMILPLANHRDKVTQVVWGRRFFEHTFQRPPEGMWLAETAVDTESLSVLARHHIKFTILAQNQVDAVRPLAPGGARGEGPFQKLGSQVDPREPYRVFWGDGPDDHIDVFVYDGQVSRAVAFENLLRDGAAFSERVLQAFGAPKEGPVLVNLATDGESYGHHFHFGEMALAWLLDSLARPQGKPGDPVPEDAIALTNYGEFLSLFPPTKEARIVEDSSWSCAHGIERWRSDCGCHTGGDPAWNQKWRTPLRDGLDWLRDQLIGIFERESQGLFQDPWAARDAYIDVLLSEYVPDAQTDFLDRHTLAHASDLEARTKALELMESQLMAMYMFTSCAWFFDDLAGLEPIQNMRYAARAIELCQKHTPIDLTLGLLGYLRKAIPNDRNYATGEDIWVDEVEGTNLNASQTAGQWGAALAMKTPNALKECRYIKVKNESSERVFLVRGDELPQILTGKAEFTEIRLKATREKSVLVLADNGPKLDIVVPEAGDDNFAKARRLFLESGVKALRKGLDDLFPGAARFTLDTLWPGAREDILTHLLKDFFEDLLAYTSKAFNNYKDALVGYSLKSKAWDWMDAFVFRVMAENELAHILKPMADGRPIDIDQLKGLLSLDTGGSTRNGPVISEASEKYLGNLFRQLKFGPGRPTLLEEIASFLKLVKSTLKDVDLWDSQNQFYYLLENRLSFLRSISEPEKNLLKEIGRTLGFSPKIAETVILNQPQ